MLLRGSAILTKEPSEGFQSALRGAASQAGDALRDLSRSPNALTGAALLLAFVGLEWVSSIHEYKGVPVTPWNPGLGVVFAWMVMRGPAYGLVLFTGVIIAEIVVLHTELAWPVILAMATVVSVSYATVAAVVRRRLRLDVGLHHVGDVLRLLAAGACGALLSATLVSLLLLATGELQIADLRQASIPLLVGDIIGVAVMTPLLLRLVLRRTETPHEALVPLVPEFVLYAVVTGVALWLIVGRGSPDDYMFLTLLFLPVVAAGVRHGIDGSCLALAMTQLALVALLHRHGYDAPAFTEFQIVMLILTTTGLLVGVIVSERERADLAAREAEARLRETQAVAARAARMNLVSGMASALAHEINQPMTAARALARSAQQILRASAPDLERANTNLANLVTQIDHAGAVVRRMREFLRRGEPHLSTLHVASLLDEALALARPEAAARKIEIELDVEHTLPRVFADRVQFQQVILNLVHNAIEAIVESRRTDGRIRVGAYLMEKDAVVEFRVSDNGVGVPPGTVLFEPLSSSKSEGLGLGLSICASIVQAHGGRIWLQSSEAGATEFRFSVPVPKEGLA